MNKLGIFNYSVEELEFAGLYKVYNQFHTKPFIAHYNRKNANQCKILLSQYTADTVHILSNHVYNLETC